MSYFANRQVNPCTFSFHTQTYTQKQKTLLSTFHLVLESNTDSPGYLFSKITLQSHCFPLQVPLQHFVFPIWFRNRKWDDARLFLKDETEVSLDLEQKVKSSCIKVVSLCSRKTPRLSLNRSDCVSGSSLDLFGKRRKSFICFFSRINLSLLTGFKIGSSFNH